MSLKRRAVNAANGISPARPCVLQALRSLVVVACAMQKFRLRGIPTVRTKAPMPLVSYSARPRALPNTANFSIFFSKVSVSKVSDVHAFHS